MSGLSTRVRWRQAADAVVQLLQSRGDAAPEKLPTVGRVETGNATSVMSHTVYGVPTALLAEPTTDEQKLGDAVHVVATKPSGNDGIICDAQGRIYTTDFEDTAFAASIRRAVTFRSSPRTNG